MTIYDYDVDFVKGVDNEMTDWSSQSITRIYCLEELLKEEFVIKKGENDSR